MIIKPSLRRAGNLLECLHRVSSPASKQGEETIQMRHTDDARVYSSCHNITKGQFNNCTKQEVGVEDQRSYRVRTMYALVQSLFNTEMKAAWNEITNNLCGSIEGVTGGH